MTSDRILRWIARWVATTLAIYAVGALLYPHIQVDDFATAIWAGLVLGLFNATLRPLLIFFTLPVTVVTLGLFLLVINAFMLYLVGEIVAGVTIASFGWALLGGLLISLLSALISALIDPTRPNVHVEIRRY